MLNRLHDHKNNHVRIEPEPRDGFAMVSSLNNLEKKDIYPLKEAMFENHTFPIPNNYDKYLKGLYGNYKAILPSEELQQYRHSIKIYRL
jgi:phosphorylcholine metabolism protein LicD